MPALILAGEEEYLISQRVRSLQEQYVDPAWASFNFARLENPDLKQVIDIAATVPFGPGNRMVLIDRCALFTKKRGATSDGDGAKDKSAAKLVDDFEAALASVAANTYLVFACPHNFDKSLKVSKAAEKHAQIETFGRIKYYAGAANHELISFCNKEAKQHGVGIDDDAIFYLAESTEVDLRQISSEIKKAAVYILPEKRVTLETVTLLSPHYSHVFALMDHWALREKDRVLESIHELQARQVSAHMVVAAMQTVLSKWIVYKTEYERVASVPSGGRDVRKRDVPLRDVANRIDSRMAFVIEKDLRKIKHLPLEYLVKKKKELTDLEFMVKTGQVPESHALEMFFTR
jgi:DNA polymerase-3 subunit delta